jgi:hypothetical protein
MLTAFGGGPNLPPNLLGKCFLDKTASKACKKYNSYCLHHNLKISSTSNNNSLADHGLISPSRSLGMQRGMTGLGGLHYRSFAKLSSISTTLALGVSVAKLMIRGRGYGFHRFR